MREIASGNAMVLHNPQHELVGLFSINWLLMLVWFVCLCWFNVNLVASSGRVTDWNQINTPSSTILYGDGLKREEPFLEKVFGLLGLGCCRNTVDTN